MSQISGKTKSTLQFNARKVRFKHLGSQTLRLIKPLGNVVKQDDSSNTLLRNSVSNRPFSFDMARLDLAAMR